ncbi:hypothetical protein PUMCH_001687 [Australozyma saopauloensis]|uniref:HSF-type DNA-binding domain-containing protein n=1 Tax=Australozyma saopauloensis TaxID=291208 RepID=A0AAX4H837_9ASCO|nr:hypothetical protein PUMCH_001687 [[Candida] saopauloensis]
MTQNNSKQSELPVKKNAFVHKLYDMLSNKLIAHLIWWADTPEANTFLLCPNKEFAEALSSYFKHENVASFVRQLHMYGFHKVSDPTPGADKGSAIWEFRHSSGRFRKNDEGSLVFIKRRLQLSSLSQAEPPVPNNATSHPNGHPHYEVNHLPPNAHGQYLYNPNGYQQYAVQYYPMGAEAQFGRPMLIHPQLNPAIYPGQPGSMARQLPSSPYPGYAFYPPPGMVQFPVPSATGHQLLPHQLPQGQQPGFSSGPTNVGPPLQIMLPGASLYQQHYANQGAMTANHVFAQHQPSPPQEQQQQQQQQQLHQQQLHQQQLQQQQLQQRSRDPPPILAPIGNGNSIKTVSGAAEQSPTTTNLDAAASDSACPVKYESPSANPPSLARPLVRDQSQSDSLSQASLLSVSSRQSLDQDNSSTQSYEDRAQMNREQNRMPSLTSRPSSNGKQTELLLESATPISYMLNPPRDVKTGESFSTRPLDPRPAMMKDSLKLESPKMLMKQVPLPPISENMFQRAPTMYSAPQADISVSSDTLASRIIHPFNSSEPSSSISMLFPSDAQIPRLPGHKHDSTGVNTSAIVPTTSLTSLPLVSQPHIPTPRMFQGKGVAVQLLNDDQPPESGAADLQTSQGANNSSESLKKTKEEEIQGVSKSSDEHAKSETARVRVAKVEHLLDDDDSEYRKKQRCDDKNAD